MKGLHDKKKIKDSATKDKGIDAMVTAVKIQKEEDLFAEKMKSYLVQLTEESSCDEAKKALRRTGITTSKGQLKKTIVSGK